MYQISNLKKVRTYYNKFVTSLKRSNVDIKVELSSDILIHTIQFDNLGIRALVSGEENENFEPLNLKFEEWYKLFDSVQKGVKDVQVSNSNGYFAIDEEKISSIPSKSGGGNWKELCTINMEALNNAFNIHNVSVSNGKLNCNNNIFFCIKDDVLKIINTNDIILQESIIYDVDGEDIIFAINNMYASNMKKWFMFANSNCMDITILILGNFIRFVCESDDNNIYEMIVPINTSIEMNKIYNTLTSIISNKWIGTKVELDEDNMYQIAVEEAIANLFANGNGNKKITKKELKKSLDDFTNAENKIEAFKKLNKAIEVPFLSLAKSVGEDNIYILRNLYTNYMSSISEFDYLVYYLNTKANALLFGHKDELFSFKTLFMLRKPKEAIVEISNEELDEDEVETEIIEESDYDVFEPT